MIGNDVIGHLCTRRTISPAFSRYIHYVCCAVCDDMVFVSAILWEEMGKADCYKVDVSITADGVIHESQCACTVQGPSAHCKHVQTVLYVLVAFSKGREILAEITCAQVKFLDISLCWISEKKSLQNFSCNVYFIFFFVCLYDWRGKA